jgi:hypothetical protein
MERLPPSNAGDDEMRDTIELAREANEYADTNWALWPTGNRWKKIRDERFAEIVRADEREAIISRLLEIGALEDGAFIEAIRNRGNI